MKAWTWKSPKTGKWVAFWYAEENGKKVQRQKTFRLKKDADTFASDKIKEIEGGTYVAPSKITVGEWLDHYMANVAPLTLGASALEIRKSIVEGRIKPKLGDIELQKLTTAQVQKAVAEWDKEYAALTVHHTVAALKVALRQALRSGVARRDVMDGVILPKASKKNEMHILSRDDVDLLLSAFHGTEDYAPVMVAVSTGLRRGELMALRWQDLEGNVLRIRHSLEVTSKGLHLKEPKTGKQRKVTLDVHTLRALKEHRRLMNERRLRVGPDWQDEGWMFPDGCGKAQQPNNFAHRITRMAKLLGMKNFSLHDLRHTHASQLLAAGFSVKVVSERLGHASAAMTLNVYSHVIPGIEEQAAQAMEKMLGGCKSIAEGC